MEVVVKPRYIFIVGLPKTGTKLIRNILENSRYMQCKISPETFFLGHFLSPGMRHEIRKMGDMSDDANIHELVDYMYSGQFTGTYWEQLKSGHLGVDREALLQELLNSGRSDKDIYEVILRIHARGSDTIILGDKTPGHLYHVPTLLEWFPEAKIIHTFRDPRAIMASEWQKRVQKKPATFYAVKPTNPLYSLMIVLHVTITWLYAVKLHHKYQKRYPQNYYLSKFEDLVSEPEKYVRELCRFLGVEFDSEMLNPPRVGSSYSREGGIGFDQQALTRWQYYLKPWMKTWLLFWGKKYLREFDYII
jgi:hypothetical protein